MRRLLVALPMLMLLALGAWMSPACASATYIELDIRTRPELCSTSRSPTLSEVGIVVTTESKVDEPERSPLTHFTFECDESTGRVGTLVITPGNEGPESAVAIRVVAALNNNSAHSCDDSEGRALKNCIITKRIARFVPGTRVPVTVIFETECNGIECPDGLVCVKGGLCAPVSVIPSNPDSDPDAQAIVDATGISDVFDAKFKDASQ